MARSYSDFLRYARPRFLKMIARFHLVSSPEWMRAVQPPICRSGELFSLLTHHVQFRARCADAVVAVTSNPRAAASAVIAAKRGAPYMLPSSLAPHGWFSEEHYCKS